MTTQAYRIQRSSGSVRDVVGVAAMTAVALTGFAVSVINAQEAEGTAREVESLCGPTQPLGEGTMRTYVEVERGVPVEVGVALSERALEGLPMGHGPGAIVFEGHHVMYEYVLDLPADNPTPFRHVALNWNVGGHEPIGIYDKPHFDFHFNLIDNEARRAIAHEDPEFEAKAARYPAESYLPAGYAALPDGVPAMGAHWIDPTSPELNGAPFSETFIFGTWDGELIFAEPMITKALVATPGYYPSSYSIRWDAEAKEYRVSLGGMVSR